MTQTRGIIEEFAKLPLFAPDAGASGSGGVKGLPGLHVLIGSALPALTAKMRAAIPPSKYLLHIHPPTSDQELLWRARAPGDRTLFLEIPGDASLQGRLAGLIRALRPDRADITVNNPNDAHIADAIPLVKQVVEMELPNLAVDRGSELTRFRCSLLNMGLALANAPFAVRAATPARPAVVCGAGPSLAGRLDALRRASEAGFPVIACGHAAVKLFELGFSPDFVVEADPRCRINWRRVEGAPDAPLAALTCVDPAVAARFQNRLWFEGDCQEFSELLPALGWTPERVRISRGVIVTALDFAFSLGCGEVALVACELALAPDGSTHFGSRRADGDDSSLLEVPSTIPGEKVKTTTDFNEIRLALESHLERSGRAASVFNCAPVGAAISGVANLSLDAFVDARAKAHFNSRKFDLIESPLPSSVKASASEFMAAVDAFADVSAKLAGRASVLRRELSAAKFDETRFKAAKTAFDAAVKVEAAMACSRPASSVFALLKRKASDVFDEAPGSNLTHDDASGQLRLLERKSSFAASLARELSGDLRAALSGAPSTALSRDPADFASFRALASELVSSNNPELAAAVERDSLPPPETAGFRIHLRFEEVPHVSKIMPDASALQFGGLLSGPIDATALLARFAEDFDPSKQQALILAPGDYSLLASFAKRFPGEPCVLLEPWPELFGEIARRCTVLARLPESSSFIVAHESMPSWRQVLAKAVDAARARGLALRVLTNPRTAALPEVQALLQLENLK